MLERGVPGARRMVVLLGEDEVDVAETQRRQGVLGLGLDELALERRIQLGERAERGITSACAAVWNDATRTRPETSPDARARSASAVSSCAITASAWVTRRRPASVSCTPRPTRSISGTPASRSSAASCWDTADGV